MARIDANENRYLSITINMKIQMLILVCSLSLNACGQQSKTNQSVQTIKTENKMKDQTVLKPVKTLIEAMDAEDAEVIRAQFAKTATQTYGAEGIMKTPEETAKWLESDIINRRGKVAKPEYTVLSDKEVVVKGQYASQGYSNKANFLFTVENGQITSWRMRY